MIHEVVPPYTGHVQSMMYVLPILITYRPGCSPFLYWSRTVQDVFLTYTGHVPFKKFLPIVATHSSGYSPYLYWSCTVHDKSFVESGILSLSLLAIHSILNKVQNSVLTKVVPINPGYNTYLYCSTETSAVNFALMYS